MEELRYERREIAKVVILNERNEILKIKELSLGGEGFVNCTIKEVMTEAVKMRAPKIVLIHNHPSGDPTPSEVDVEYTELSMKVAGVLGIEFMDHIVIGNGKYISILSEMASKIAKDLKTSAVLQGLQSMIVEHAMDFACDMSKDAVLASDLPVTIHDINAMAQGRISMIILPEASTEVINAANKFNIALITTGFTNRLY